MASLQPRMLYKNKRTFYFVQLFRTSTYFIFTPLHFLMSVYRLWQRMYVLGSFEPGTKFRLPGRFLRRYIMCVTAASGKMNPRENKL